ncbi:hypothetical protein Hanom_Chr16g01468531 [Helianthus anomalus]
MCSWLIAAAVTGKPGTLSLSHVAIHPPFLWSMASPVTMLGFLLCIFLKLFLYVNCFLNFLSSFFLSLLFS